jgi:hypothetical protein
MLAAGMAGSGTYENLPDETIESLGFTKENKVWLKTYEPVTNIVTGLLFAYIMDMRGKYQIYVGTYIDLFIYFIYLFEYLYSAYSRIMCEL